RLYQGGVVADLRLVELSSRCDAEAGSLGHVHTARPTEGVAGPFAADDLEVAGTVIDEPDVVTVGPARPQRPATGGAGARIGAREIQRQPSPRDEHVLGGLGDVPVPQVHALDQRVADRETLIGLPLVDERSRSRQYRVAVRGLERVGVSAGRLQLAAGPVWQPDSKR